MQAGTQVSSRLVEHDASNDALSAWSSGMLDLHELLSSARVLSSWLHLEAVSLLRDTARVLGSRLPG